MKEIKRKTHFLEWAGVQGQALVTRRDRIVVSTLRCGRSNPGSNPGHGIANTMSRHKGCILAPEVSWTSRPCANTCNSNMSPVTPLWAELRGSTAVCS